MFAYAKIAGGQPSGASALTDHLLTQTLSREAAGMAQYYQTGMTPTESGDPSVAELRRDIHPEVALGLGVEPGKPLSRKELNAFLSGHRLDGKPIEGKTYSKERTTTDQDTGEVKKLTPIGSVDFVVTPCKSVSVAWAFAEGAERAQIYQAFDAASNAAMAHLERNVAVIRKGHAGLGGSEPGRLGWISFDHCTSRPTILLPDGDTTEVLSVPQAGDAARIRAGDPDLHRHNIVVNGIFGENGRVGSLNMNLLKGFLHEADGVFHATLATELRKAGFEVELDRDTGAARMTAIPIEVCDHFSKRSIDGEQAAREYAKSRGLVWDDMTTKGRAQLLRTATGNAKELAKQLDELQARTGISGRDRKLLRQKLAKDDIANFSDWRRQAKDDLGWEPPMTLIREQKAPELTPEQRIELAYETAQHFVEREFARRSVVSGYDMRVAAARGLIASGMESPDDINRVTEKMREWGVRQGDELTKVIWRKEDGERYATVSTELHETQEHEFVSLAVKAGNDRSGAIDRNNLQKHIDQSGLRFDGGIGGEQIAAVERLAENRLAVVIGVAGSGKTSLLRVPVAAWREEGRDVHGVALAWKAADSLADTGIERENIRALSVFMSAAQKGEIALTERSVVVVDEVALLGVSPQQGLGLLRLQEKHGFGLKLLGDPMQSAAIEAGPIVTLLERALGEESVPRILSTVRQERQRDREIAGLWRQGKAADAIAMKRDDGTAEMVPGGYKDAVNRVADLWAERRRMNHNQPGYTITVSAPTNADAHAISEAIRHKRREMGELGPDLVRLDAVDADGREYQMPLAVGDRVRLYRSTGAKFGDRIGGSIGRNGSTLEVRDIGPDGLTLRTANGREGRVAWENLAARSGRTLLGFGDCLTIHTSQGLTSQDHINAMPGGTQAVTGYAAYTADSRHRQKSFLVISQGAERRAIKRHRAINDAEPITREQEWAYAAANLSRQPEKESALGFIDRAGDVRRGSVRMFQRGLQKMEARERHEQTRSHMNEVLAVRRSERNIAMAMERVESIARSWTHSVTQRVQPVIQRALARGLERQQMRQGQGPSISM